MVASKKKPGVGTIIKDPVKRSEDENMTGKDRPGLREVKLAILELQDHG